MPRIPRYKTPDDLEKMVEAYFLQCEVDKKRTTQAGLCVFAGLNNKQAFNDLEKRKDVKGASLTWKELVQKTRLRLEDAAWQRGKTIDIFYLKNYHGMVDKKEVDVNAEVNARQITINTDMDPQKAAELYGQLIK